MNSWNSYPNIYALGHHMTTELVGEVYVQEKVDGSQISWGVDDEGGLRCRSKGAEIYLDAPEKMFAQGVRTIQMLSPILHRGWTYRGEYLSKPHHNTLVYDRVPKDNIILFDINTGHEQYLDYWQVVEEGIRIGLETVPLLFVGKLTTLEAFRPLLDTESVLGGQKIEGVVVKPRHYDIFGMDKKVVMGKFVSEVFKEVHAGSWKENNPGNKDIIERLGNKYNTQARWMKAVQHLHERGVLEDSPKDIGLLLKEIPEDVFKECLTEIENEIMAWAIPHLRRKVVAGFPQWYKEELLKKQFEE